MKNNRFFKSNGKNRKIKTDVEIQELVKFNVNHGLKKKPQIFQDTLVLEKEEFYSDQKK